MSLSSAEISAMRTAANAILPDTCTIQRVTRASDGMGGYTDTWATLASSVACRLDSESINLREESVQAAIFVVDDYTLYLKNDQDITARDRVVLNSITYEVTVVLSHASYLFARRAKLVKLE
jgi:head-tail adaptor